MLQGEYQQKRGSMLLSDADLYSSGGLLGAGAVTGEAGENNCYACNGGALMGGVTGACGNSSTGTIAIFARTF